MYKSIFATTLVAGLTLAAWSVPAKADLYMATNWMTPVHILNENPYQRWAKDVKEATDGSIEFEVHSSGSLVPARSTMQGIRDNVAAVGIVYPGYTPSEQPLNNVLNDLVFVADDDFAAAFAFIELGMSSPSLQNEWKRNGGLFAGGYATPVYNFMCMKPVRSLADAKGMKTRTAGGAQTDWIKHIGGVPVSVPIADVYSGLERGSLDCTLSDPTNLDKGNKFWEVAKSVTTLPMGVVLGATYVYNIDFWQSRTSEERKILLDTMAKGVARSQVQYHIGVQTALEGAKERNLEIITPDESLTSELQVFAEQFIAALPEQSIKVRKVEDPTELIQEYLGLYDKWKELAKDVDRTDEEAVYELVYQNLYSKIDENTFGM
ncbi:C4-dicarboxylate TRAP transporter substrate-binding protein [Paenalcaligenes hominis]|uniref:C4-dicarboxylate TRAP transporter substrate-binding protein n=1 Tax=Paenalcaligenes hominis TaxID=643674 RepID=UPI0035251FA4